MRLFPGYRQIPVSAGSATEMAPESPRHGAPNQTESSNPISPARQSADIRTTGFRAARDRGAKCRIRIANSASVRLARANQPGQPLSVEILLARQRIVARGCMLQHIPLVRNIGSFDATTPGGGTNLSRSASMPARSAGHLAGSMSEGCMTSSSCSKLPMSSQSIGVSSAPSRWGRRQRVSSAR